MIFVLRFTIMRVILITKGGATMVKNRIAQFRHENGMNQRELGEKLGVGQTTVSAWETGRNEPDSDSLGRMAKLFHTTIGYLMGYEPESYLHGLTKKEHARVIEEQEHQRDIERWQRQNELEQQGVTDEEIEEYQLRAAEARWHEKGKADTLEGFLVSEVVDDLPVQLRKLALANMRNFATAANYKPE